MVGAVSTLLSRTTAIWPVGQVPDGGLHWAAAALNLSMPSAPSLKIGRISHWPFELRPAQADSTEVPPTATGPSS